MQINIVSDPLVDPTSPDPNEPYYYPALWIKTTKKDFFPTLVWKGPVSTHYPGVAEEAGWLHLASKLGDLL